MGRTLDNLESLAYPDPIILFPAPADPRIEAKVQDIVAGRGLDIRIFTEADLSTTRSALAKNGFPAESLEAIDMNGYGGVRNAGLLYAAMHGFNNVIMIDDDECIDAGYRDEAGRFMGHIVNGLEVLGKTGCVVDADGKKVYDGQVSSALETWPKDALFNDAVRKELEAIDRLSECTVAFGGNMVLNRKMFLRVPFDPYGTRGEDDDYVLNARYCGLPFFFDKDLVLLHLPPRRHDSFWTRHRQDILRFKYLREKAKIFGFEPKSLGTFMEYFIQDDLEYKAVSSSVQAAMQFIDTDRAEHTEFLNNAIAAEATPVRDVQARAEMFLRFMDAWETAVPSL